MRKYILLLLLPVLCSCNSQELEEVVYTTARIPISVDWSVADITPQNVTVLFYDQENNNALALEHKYSSNNNEVQSYAEVPVGKYTVVIFNELRDQIQNVGVRGYENLSTLEFYAQENSDVTSRSDEEVYVKAPDVVATSMISHFEVTEEMLTYTHGRSSRADALQSAAVNMLVGVTPKRRASQMNVTLHITGLNNARMPALIDMLNVSGGYFVATNKNSVTPARYQFSMENRIYDEGSATQGTISTKDVPIQLFGLLGDPNSMDDQPSDKPIVLDILFMLVDKEKTIVNYVIDVTKDIKLSNQLNGTITLDLNIDMETALPDVVPEGPSMDSAFGTTLENWNTVDVPLTSN